MTARAWVGCLGCYNAGALVGAWVDAVDAADVTVERLHSGDNQGRVSRADVFRADPYAGWHEELWVMDFEGFDGWLTGECSPVEAAKVAETVEAIADAGFDADAVRAWAEHVGEPVREWGADVREAFEDAYAGEADSGAEFAEQLAEDTGAFLVYGGDGGSDRPSDVSDRWPFTHIDWSGAWRDLELGGDYFAVERPAGGVWVFRS